MLWILRLPIGALAGSALVEDDGAARADAIVVLGGDAFGSRILRGAELKKNGYSTRLLVSSPADLMGHETDQTIAFAVRHGDSASLFEPVLLPSDVKSTRTEALYIGHQLRDQGITSIDLVTSNYHTRRAAWIWRKENPWLTVHVAPAPDPYFSPEKWFETREGEKTFLLEWTKTVASRLER